MKGISVTALRVGDASSFENGTFAEIICVKADLQMRVPEYISFEHASALGVGVLTVGRAFDDRFGLPYFFNFRRWGRRHRLAAQTPNSDLWWQFNDGRHVYPIREVVSIPLPLLFSKELADDSQIKLLRAFNLLKPQC